MNKLIPLLTLAGFLITPSLAQGKPKRLPTKPASDAKQSSKNASRKTPELKDFESKPRRFWFFSSLSTSFDTNIDHEPQAIGSFGLVPSMGFHFQDNAEKPAFELEYEVGLHRYTNTDEWDRTSHSLRASYKRRLFDRWYSRTTGELTLKGSSEDRELNNQSVLGQQIEYRATSNIRLIAFAAYRLKRDPFDRGKNAIDPYIGAKFVQRLPGNRRLDFRYRYDHNRSQDPRNRYVRWAYGASFETPVLRHDRLTFDFSYRPQLYARTVKVDHTRVPRADQRWNFTVLWERPLGERLKLSMFYRFEKRFSNDPDKRYIEHEPGIQLSYWW